MIPFVRRISTRLKAASRPLTVGASMAVVMMTPLASHAQSWSGTLLGSNEYPTTSSTATGFVFLSLSGNFLNVSLNWSGLTGGSLSAGHIHCCTAPGSNVGIAAGFLGLPPAASGTYTTVLNLADLALYTGTFATDFGGGTGLGSKAALINGLNSGLAYVDLHTAAYPGGEIRANVLADPIVVDPVVAPEPTSIAMLGFGLATVGVAVRRKRRAR